VPLADPNPLGFSNTGRWDRPSWKAYINAVRQQSSHFWGTTSLCRLYDKGDCLLSNFYATAAVLTEQK
jgi:hypothetical protein